MRTARLISSAASVNATVAMDGPVILNGIIGHNARTSAVYLKLYSKLTAPSETDTPKLTIYLPASTSFVFDLPDVVFNAGLSFRLTTGGADNDTGAVASGDILALNFIGDNA